MKAALLNRRFLYPQRRLFAADCERAQNPPCCDPSASRRYQLARDLLSDIKAPFYLIPGNHDQKDHLVQAFSTHRYLLKGGCGKEGKYLYYVINGYPVRLMGIDTVTPGLHGGGIGPDRVFLIIAADYHIRCIGDRATQPARAGGGRFHRIAPDRYPEFRSLCAARSSCGFHPAYHPFSGSIRGVFPT